MQVRCRYAMNIPPISVLVPTERRLEKAVQIRLSLRKFPSNSEAHAVVVLEGMDQLRVGRMPDARVLQGIRRVPVCIHHRVPERRVERLPHIHVGERWIRRTPMLWLGSDDGERIVRLGWRAGVG